MSVGLVLWYFWNSMRNQDVLSSAFCLILFLVCLWTGHDLDSPSTPVVLKSKYWLQWLVWVENRWLLSTFNEEHLISIQWWMDSIFFQTAVFQFQHYSHMPKQNVYIANFTRKTIIMDCGFFSQITTNGRLFNVLQTVTPNDL